MRSICVQKRHALGRGGDKFLRHSGPLSAKFHSALRLQLSKHGELTLYGELLIRRFFDGAVKCEDEGNPTCCIRSTSTSAITNKMVSWKAAHPFSDLRQKCDNSSVLKQNKNHLQAGKWRHWQSSRKCYHFVQNDALPISDSQLLLRWSSLVPKDCSPCLRGARAMQLWLW